MFQTCQEHQTSLFPYHIKQSHQDTSLSDISETLKQGYILKQKLRKEEIRKTRFTKKLITTQELHEAQYNSILKLVTDTLHIPL